MHAVGFHSRLTLQTLNLVIMKYDIVDLVHVQCHNSFMECLL